MPLPSPMALDKLLNFPESQPPQMKNEENNVQGYHEDMRLCLTLCLAPNKW